MTKCGNDGTFVECRGDGVATWFTWRGLALCRRCMADVIGGRIA